MKKESVNLYFASLAITLLLFGFLSAFFLVDAGAGRRDRGNSDQLFAVEQPAPEQLEIQILGNHAQIDLTQLETPARLRESYAPLLFPRALLSAEYAAGYMAYWGGIAYGELQEYIYQQEVVAAQTQYDEEEASP